MNLMKPVSAPYKLLATLLYGQQEWLERREGGHMVVPTRLLGDAAGIRRAATVRLAGQALHEWGILEEFQWHGRYMILKLAAPKGFQRV